MGTFQHDTPFGGAYARRFTRYSGLFFDEFAVDSAWVRETAVIHLPPMADTEAVVLRGEFKAHPKARGPEAGFPTMEVFVDGLSVATVAAGAPGPWETTVTLGSESSRLGSIIYLRLSGVGFTNALAWLGRVTRVGLLQRFRSQNRNRQLRIAAIESPSGEKIYDFSMREAPYVSAFARAHTLSGINVVGFLTADLGIGESARCMVRASDAAGIPTSLVPLKLNCRNRLGDMTYGSRLQDTNPQGTNIFHIDPPVVRDIDHHHGPEFRRHKYNIGYFAWELPEFPDAWMASFDYLDEVWCPSHFVSESISLKAPFPVITMPHSIGFVRPGAPVTALRAKFGLPQDRYLFLCLFDLNSYSARKNPRGAIEAFRNSGVAPETASLVIKVHNAELNPGDFAALNEAVKDIPGTVVIGQTLSRTDVYALEAACDCFVSLHRSEGFGFGIAECMYLGKPVIATDWSATSEYLDRHNGYPVRFSLVKLTENHGPYTKGSTWADPDVANAAEIMAHVVTHPTEAAQLGAAALQTIEERFSPAVVGARYRRRLEAIAGT